MQTVHYTPPGVMGVRESSRTRRGNIMKNIIIGQSGGPTAVINASLYGAVKGAQECTVIGRVYGMVNGIQGFLGGQFMDMESLSEEELELLKCTPAAYLGSCRCRLPENLDAPVYRELFEKLEELEIGYFAYIGGNDSMDTVSKLALYAEKVQSDIRFAGIPKTIDNDLICTDHTPGYGSAAKYVAATVRSIVMDASVYRQKSVTIVELMGRDAGWLTAASMLARKFEGDNPALIYLPEAVFDMERFVRDVENVLKVRNAAIVCVSEGIIDKNGKLICEYGADVQTDAFGHKMMSGCGKVLEAVIRERLNIKVRSIELNVSQRCSGMLQSATDILEAAMAGRRGVEAMAAGMTGRMVCFSRIQGTSYQLECDTVDVHKVCNQVKTFPQEWIINGNDIAEEFAAYARPLIQGEIKHKMEDGLPKYLYRETPVGETE